MKITYPVLLSLIINIASHAQDATWVKFIYYGKQLKPQGTLVIAVDSLISPKSKYPDFTFEQVAKTTFNAVTNAAFGRGIRTDQNTLKAILTFVQNGRFASEKSKSRSDFDAGYGIIDSRGQTYYLPDCNFPPFFRAISERLMEERLDDTVAMAFKYYYSFWRKHPNGNQEISDSAPPPLGIPITKIDFDSLVQQVLIEFQSANNKRTIEDYYTFVRVEDTYAFYGLDDQNDKLLFQLFRNTFPEIEKGLGAWGGGST